VSEYVQVYSYCHQYRSDNAITIPVTLTRDRSVNIDLLGKLDTGSTFCIFERAYAGLLGLDLESGHRQRFATATGAFYSVSPLLLEVITILRPRPHTNETARIREHQSHS